MYAYDFEYDGISLSAFGFMVCEFDGNGGLENINTGSEISFVTVPVMGGRRFAVAGSKYEKCLGATFQICKNPETHNEDEMVITDDQFRELSRWLNRREYCWFHSFDSDVVTRPWVRASFTLTRIDIGKITYGIELNMTTDAPFGYGEERYVDLTFTSESLTKTFNDLNDEIGYTYPEMTVTCKQSGNLTLTDDITGCSFKVNNCTNGEVISLSGDTMIISTSLTTHAATIADDYNYDPFCFGNTYKNRINTITASIPCEVRIKYRPIIKDTL